MSAVRASSATRPSAIFEGNVVYGVLQSRALGELRAGDPMKLKGEATTRMLIEGQPEWRSDASFDGDLVKLPLTAKLHTPFRADMKGELLDLSKAFHWTGVAQVHNFDLQAFGARRRAGHRHRNAAGGRRDECVSRARSAGHSGAWQRVVRHRVRRQLLGSRGECHELRDHTPGHGQSCHGLGHDRNGGERTQAGARGHVERRALAAGGTVQRRTSSVVRQPRRPVHARRSLALCDHRPR